MAGRARRGVKPTEGQLKALRRIMWWRWAHWGCFPLTMLSMLTLVGAFQKPGWWPYVIPVGVSLAGYGVSWYRVNRARCPRCGAFFFVQQGPFGPRGTSFPLQQRCQHCGMAIRRPA